MLNCSALRNFYCQCVSVSNRASFFFSHVKNILCVCIPFRVNIGYRTVSGSLTLSFSTLSKFVCLISCSCIFFLFNPTSFYLFEMVSRTVIISPCFKYRSRTLRVFFPPISWSVVTNVELYSGKKIK